MTNHDALAWKKKMYTYKHTKEMRHNIAMDIKQDQKTVIDEILFDKMNQSSIPFIVVQ